MKRSWWFIIGGAVFGIFFWLIDSVLDFSFFYNLGLVDVAFTRIPGHEIYVRTAVFVLFVVFGFIMAKACNRCHRNQELLAHTNDIWTRTFDSLGDAVSVHAEDFTIVNANKAMCAMLGKLREEVIGKKCYRLFHHTDRPIDACPCHISRESGKRETSEFREPSLNKWVQISTTPVLDEHNKMFAYVHLVTDVTEEREHKAVLHEKLDLYELIVQHAAEAIVVVQDDRLVFASRPMEKITGYSSEELMTKPFTEFVHPDDRSLVSERHQQRLENGTALSVYPFRTVRKDGAERWLEVNTTTIEWEGRPAALAVLGDVTERMQQQSRLQEGMIKYAQLLSSMASGVIVYDVINDGEDYLVKEINNAAERIENVNRKDVLGTNARMSFPYVAGGGLAHVYKEVWKTGRPRQQSREITTADGKKGWRVHYVQRLQTGELADVFEDVTERRRAERGQRETESRYRTVIDNASEAVFIAQDDVFKLTNPKVSEITGYTSNELASRKLIEFVHLDDQAMVLENYEKLLKGEKQPTQAPFRLIHKAGRVCWVQINAVRITWDDKPATLNFLVDVTDHRRAEEQLRESEERFRTLNEASFEGVILHEDGVIIEANAAAVRMMGYEWTEAKGSRLIDIVAPTSRHVIADIVQGVYNTSHEIELVRGDGARILVEVQGKEMPYMGRTVGMVAVRDVSERKQAEGEIRKRMEEIERLNEYLIGREMRIIEVKKEVNVLLDEMGKTTRYKV